MFFTLLTQTFHILCQLDVIYRMINKLIFYVLFWTTKTCNLNN